MMRQRVIAFLMIALEAAAAEYMLFQFEWFPVVLVVIAAAGIPGLTRARLGKWGTVAVAVGLTLFIGYGTQTFLFANRLPILPFLTGYAYPIGWCILTIQVAILFLRTEDGRLPVYFPALGAAVMAYAGQRGRPGSNEPVYHAAALMFVILTVLYWSSSRTNESEPPPKSMRVRGALIQGSVLLFALPVAFVTSTLIGANHSAIDAAFSKLFQAVAPAARTGFSTQAQLDGVKRIQTEDGNRVALRVYAVHAPGYMRGRAYDFYNGDKWTVTVKEAPLARATADASIHSNEADGALFEVGRGRAPYASLNVVPTATFEGCLFAPLDTAYIQVPEVLPSGDANGNLSVSETLPNSEYRVLTAARPDETLTDDARRRYTETPATLDPGIRNLASRLFEGLSTSREKSAAVVQYFAEHYSYQLGIDVPTDKDPMAYFLLEQPPAHCEYFATGATLLLRLGGVPCRYVTGFVASERNAFGGYWVAHNKDAHAWAEAYDDDEKAWRTVEATVSGGIPASDSQPQTAILAQFQEFATYLAQSLRAALGTGKWTEMLSLLWGMRWVMAALGAGLVAVMAARALGRRRKTRHVASRASLSPEELELLRLRQHVDRTMRRRGLVRRPDETIRAFADRIAATAIAEAEPAKREALTRAIAWYRRYNETRFCGTVSVEAIAELRGRANG